MADPSKSLISENEISMRSYLIWEAEGRPTGRDVEHWLRAEAELGKEMREANERLTAVVASKSRASDSRGDRPQTTTAKR